MFNLRQIILNILILLHHDRYKQGIILQKFISFLFAYCKTMLAFIIHIKSDTYSILKIIWTNIQREKQNVYCLNIMIARNENHTVLFYVTKNIHNIFQECWKFNYNFSIVIQVFLRRLESLKPNAITHKMTTILNNTSTCHHNHLSKMLPQHWLIKTKIWPN